MNLTTTKQAAQNIFSRLNWKIYPPTLFSIITFLSIIPCVIFLPERFAWENSIIENIQLVVILLTFRLAIFAPKYKKLFNWIAMISVILFLRETNCGRIFFPIDGTIRPWKELLPYPYNYVPNGLFALFITYSIYYFFKSKVNRELLKIITSSKIDCINISFMFTGAVIGTIGEIKNVCL